MSASGAATDPAGEAGGDAFRIPPGHDTWTIGQGPCVFLDFSGMDNYLTKEAR